MLLLLVLLIAAWLLWSGLFKPLLLGLGAFSCLLTLYLARRMGYFDNEIFALRFGPRLIVYWAWLAKEIARSSFEVARIVMDPRLPISPQVFKIKATATHPVDQAMLANSITLTPGTITIETEPDKFLVHAVAYSEGDPDALAEMDRRVTLTEQVTRA